MNIRVYEHEGHEHEGHSHGTVASKEEVTALLKYMADHNKHHAEELHELAHGLDGDAHEYIHDAVHELEKATELMNKALELLK